ncbi:MAG: divalent cation transporter [Planctomycetota bacterium]
MTQVQTIIVLTLMAGAAMPLGAALACVDSLYPNWLSSAARHGIIAFGGGALISAVALVLVPDGCELLSLVPAAVAFGSGGIAFLALDIWLSRTNNPAGQLAAMLSDFVPEALALGAAFSTGQSVGVLLAMLIAIQNIPEGFNAYREMTESGRIQGKTVLISFSMMAFLGPASGLVGYYFLGQYSGLLGFIMLFASGGILYIIFQDIAPDAKVDQRWSPALGAVTGFLLGLIGNMLVG